VMSLVINLWVLGDSLDKANNWMTEVQQDLLNHIQVALGFIQLFLFLKTAR
jgi:hypothetical protein